jgi:exonuclease III
VLTTPHHKNYNVEESQLEPREDRLHRRRNRKLNKDMLLGTCNTRTLYRAGSLKMLSKTVQQYKHHIIALQETRWHGKGVMDTKTHTIFYSGKEKGTYEAGVAFLVDKNMKQNILDFKPINENICTIRIKSRFFNLYMINVHGPTEEKDELTKNYFYQVLEKTYNAAPRNEIRRVRGCNR